MISMYVADILTPLARGLLLRVVPLLRKLALSMDASVISTRSTMLASAGGIVRLPA